MTDHLCPSVAYHYRYHTYDWERRLSAVERNARVFLRAYQSRAMQVYRGGNTQAYNNWRTAWLQECLSHITPRQGVDDDFIMKQGEYYRGKTPRM